MATRHLDKRYTRTRNNQISYHYHISCRGGQSLTLGQEYEEYKNLFDTIDRAVIRKHLPDLLAQYQQGKLLFFGPYLALNRDRIRVSNRTRDGGSYPWSEVGSVQFDDSTVSFFLYSRSKPMQLPLENIKNLCLLQALVKQVREQ